MLCLLHNRTLYPSSRSKNVRLFLPIVLLSLLQSCFAQSPCNPLNVELTFDSISDTCFGVPQHSNDGSTHEVSNSPYPVTLVSIYYPAAEKDLAYLDGDMKTYLRRVATPIVFFTSEEFKSRIQEMRGDLPIFFVTRYSDPAQFGYISLLENNDVFEQQVQAPTVYVRPGKNANNSKIWNAKPMITAMAAIVNPFESRIFVYVDVGGLCDAVLPRGGRCLFWPDHQKIQEPVDRFDTEQIFLSTITKTWGDPTIPWFQGAWFAGSGPSVIQFANQYYEALRNISLRTLRESSILSDETTTLEVVQRYPGQFSVMTNNLIPDGPHCGGTWRVFGHTLMSTSDQKENVNCVGRGYDEMYFVPAAEVFASLKDGPRSDNGSAVLISLGLLLATAYFLAFTIRRKTAQKKHS